MSENKKGKKEKDFGGHVCSPAYAFALDNGLRKLFQRPKKVVGEYIGEGDTIIDLGCGPGFFTIYMAVMTGENGRVYAVDLQQEMLEHVRKKAAKHNLNGRIRYHRCQRDRVGLEPGQKADFMLAFYMLHETPDPGALLEEVKGLLKIGGKFLVVEPRMHVKQKTFEEAVKMAEETGYRVLDYPKKKGGRAVLLGREGEE